MRDDIGIWRSISVGKLREILTSLPHEHHVVVNDVGNILILSGEDGAEDTWEEQGFIDIGQETYEAF